MKMEPEPALSEANGWQSPTWGLPSLSPPSLCSGHWFGTGSAATARKVKAEPGRRGDAVAAVAAVNAVADVVVVADVGVVVVVSVVVLAGVVDGVG
ncbi:MAG: hypothetical protein ACRDFQ_05620 [Anaerolineales bacterium]